MFSFLRSFLRQKGAVLVLTAVMLPFVLGVTGLAIDCGNLYLTQSRLQNAADSAVLAGATTIRDDLTSNRTTVAGIISDHGRADETADNYVDENASVPEDGRGYDAMSTGGQLQYSVSLRKEVPVYLMRIFTSGKTYTVKAASKAAIIGTGKTVSNNKNVFIVKHDIYDVNSINNPDNWDIDGQIITSFNGGVAYTNGTTDASGNPINDPKYSDYKINYSMQTDKLNYFFSQKSLEERCSVNTAIKKGSDYAFQAYYTPYDMEALYKKVDAMNYVEYNKPGNQDNQNPNTNEPIFDENSSTAIRYNSTSGSCNLNVNRLPGGDRDTPVYFYISDDIKTININVNSDNERPLIICYHGTGKVHIQLNGHTFRGIIYAPNTPRNSDGFFLNANNGKVCGAIIANSIGLQGGAGHFIYEDFDGNSSIGTETTTTTGGNYEVKLL